MPFLNFGGNKYKYCNLSDMNFFMKNRYSNPDPIFPNADPRIRIHYYGKVDPGSGSTFPKCGSQDPDPYPRQNEMDPKRCFKVNRGFKNIKFNVSIPQESFIATL